MIEGAIHARIPFPAPRQLWRHNTRHLCTEIIGMVVVVYSRFLLCSSSRQFLYIVLDSLVFLTVYVFVLFTFCVYLRFYDF